MKQKATSVTEMNQKVPIADGKLEQLAYPIAEHLERYCNPHTAVVITCDHIAVVETTLSVPVALVNPAITVASVKTG